MEVRGKSLQSELRYHQEMRKNLIFLFAGIMMINLVSCTGNTSMSNDTQKGNNTTTADMEQSKLINATPEQMDGIKKALDAYVEAAVKGSSDIAKQAFASTATISYNENGKLVSNPIQALYDYYDQTGPHPASYTIMCAQVSENVAIVSIDSQFGDTSFDDMFTLVKDGNDWKIVSKIYRVK